MEPRLEATPQNASHVAGMIYSMAPLDFCPYTSLSIISLAVVKMDFESYRNAGIEATEPDKTVRESIERIG